MVSSISGGPLPNPKGPKEFLIEISLSLYADSFFITSLLKYFTPLNGLINLTTIR